MDITGLNCTRQRYKLGPNATDLHTIDVWTPENAAITPSEDKIWVIYIHGGAWRDPIVDSESFSPTVRCLWYPKSSSNPIAGFASINYRLSPYPSHPDNPSSPDDPCRNVHHPAHVEDVADALVYLEEKYHISRRYVLAGHSAGATIAYQLESTYTSGSNLPLPACVLGVAGIYDFRALVAAHANIPAYKEFMENAFPDSTHWDQYSPSKKHTEYRLLWKHAKAIIISHSQQDELVESAQASYMMKLLCNTPDLKGGTHFMEATGCHNEIWTSGSILADLISKSLNILQISQLRDT